MLSSALSRHHLLLIVAGLLLVVAWQIVSPLLAVIVVLTFFTLLGFGVAFPNWKMFGPYICRGISKRKCVALTFDDGPDPRSTPALLDLLKTAHVPATFFCIGSRVAAHPELAQRIVQDGHRVENHTQHHRNTTNFYTVSHLKSELSEAQATMVRVTGRAPELFRPPMGLSNPRIFQAARALHLRVIGWTARGLDTKLTEPDEIVGRLEKGFQPGGILLLHDGNIPAERLVITVKKLLDNLRGAGYEVVPLDQILE